MMQTIRRRGGWILAAGLILAVTAGCGGDSAPGPEAGASASLGVVARIEDFDDAKSLLEIETSSAATRIVPSHGEADGSALEVRFATDVLQPTVYMRPAQPWDWSNERDLNIAIDASNPDTESVHLRLALTGIDGDSGREEALVRGTVNIAAGASGTYYLILDGLFAETDPGFRAMGAPWDSPDKMFVRRLSSKSPDLRQVTGIAMSVRGTIREKELIVDNVRLRRNPDYDHAFLGNIVDEFGQNANAEYPIKVHSLAELKQAADAELEALDASGPMPDRSRFGGWKNGPQLDGTGYFRVEKVSGKWWLVDPDGYLFFSSGLANVRMANLTTLTGIDFRDPAVRTVDPEEVTPEDSIGIVGVSDGVRETRFVTSELRHRMFSWLPDYDGELADHYSYRRSVHRGPIKSGETYSFYRANLERRYGETEPESYVRKWEDVTMSRFLDWGFTSTGNWVDPAFYPNERIPYFANGWIIGDFKTLSTHGDVWAPMPDPFDPEFVRRAEITIGVIADEIQGSPWCVGVFVDNEKSWGRREGTVEQRYGLIIDALSKDAADSPAKAAFVQRLEDAHGAIETLNTRWQTAFSSWDDLRPGLTLPDYSPEALADLSMLLEALSEQYFRTVHDSLEAVLPNHLYLGVRMARWGMPKETVKAATRYTDVLSFNIYKEGMQPHAWMFLDEIDLPTIIGEYHMGATSDTGLFHPGLIMAADQADRAAMYRAYMESVAAMPSMVGAHWFQYVDSPLTGRAFDGENYNVGFVSVTDIPYPEMVEAARAFNSTLYPDRFGEQPQ